MTRYVYVAETDARARAESEAVILRHLAHFSSGHTSGYLGTVSAGRSDYDGLSRDVILHGSPATVIAKIEQLARARGQFADAALSALVRRREGHRLARNVRARGDAEIRRERVQARHGRAAA